MMTKQNNVFKTWSMSDLQAAMTNPEPIVDGLMNEGEAMLVYAGSGVGKSFLTYKLAECISTDKSFLGMKTASDKRVLYIDGEMGVNSIGMRVNSELDLSNIDYVPVEVNEQAICLNNTEHREQLIEIAADYDVIILDSVRVLWSLTDENSAESWKKVNTLVQALRNPTTSVIVIHHANKSEAENGSPTYSGSTNAITVFDRTLGISGIETKQLHPMKNRNGEWGDWVEECVFKIDEGELRKVSYSEMFAENLEQVIQILLNDRLSTPAAIKSKLREINKVLELGLGNNVTQDLVWKNGVEQLFGDFWEKADFSQALKGSWSSKATVGEICPSLADYGTASYVPAANDDELVFDTGSAK